MPRTRPEVTLDIRKLVSRELGTSALTRAQLRRLAPRIKKIVAQIERERAGGEHRFRELPRDRLMRQAVEEFARACRPKTANLVVLGIGGSALGAVALHQALNHPLYNLVSRRKRGGPRLFVMDNIDPTQFGAMLEVIRPELPKTLFNIVTKSGETTETLSQYLVVRKLLNRALGVNRARQQIVVTTTADGGTMRKIVEQEGYPSLTVPDGVGGRFSVLSAVGLFPAAMCGIDIKAVLKGAADMDTRVRSNSLNRNPAAMFAAVNYLYYQRGVQQVVMMPYSDALLGLAGWFRQLWAESLGKVRSGAGKKRHHIGPTPLVALGATDQHSQLQLYRDGPNDRLITFLEVDEFDRDVPIPKSSGDEPALSCLGGGSLGNLLSIEKQATERALLASERPCLTLRFPTISPYTVGQFICLMQCATVIAARLFGVNPYDQPGVELGKKITYHLLGREGYGNINAILREEQV